MGIALLTSSILGLVYCRRELRIGNGCILPQGCVEYNNVGSYWEDYTKVKIHKR
jgi:hypothetical protein